MSCLEKILNTEKFGDKSKYYFGSGSLSLSRGCFTIYVMKAPWVDMLGAESAKTLAFDIGYFDTYHRI